MAWKLVKEGFVIDSITTGNNWWLILLLSLETLWKTLFRVLSLKCEVAGVFLNQLLQVTGWNQLREEMIYQHFQTAMSIDRQKDAEPANSEMVWVAVLQ